MIEDASEIRWYVFCAGLLAVLLWEHAAPLRSTTAATIAGRWTANIGLGAINVALAIAWSAVLGPHLGTFTVWTPPELPLWLATAATVIVLDFAYFAYHVTQHKVPLLWRLHRVHHSDVEYDLTTSFRFHPIDAAVTALVLGSVMALLSAPPAAAFLFLLFRQTSDVVGHGNVRMPASLDRVLRGLLVTPNFHRIHHSPERAETDSNYGGILTLWDRLFRTYRVEPRLGHERMTLGLDEFRTATSLTPVGLLLMPFASVGRRVPSLSEIPAPPSRP